MSGRGHQYYRYNQGACASTVRGVTTRVRTPAPDLDQMTTLCGVKYTPVPYCVWKRYTNVHTGPVTPRASCVVLPFVPVPVVTMERGKRMRDTRG